MKIVRLTSCFFAAVSIVYSNVYQDAYTDRSIRGILRSVVRHDAIIRIQERDMGVRVKRLLEVVAGAVITTWPSQVVAERVESAFRPQNAASSRTLLIYICASNSDVNYTEWNVMLEEIGLMSQPKHTPWLFLIIFHDSDKGARNVRHRFRYLWDLGLFNVVILEVSFLPRHSEPVFVAAYRFNGFNGDYSRLTVYDGDVDWYPYKLRDMHGSALKVAFKAGHPYSALHRRDRRIGGLADAFSDVLSIVTNATAISARTSQRSDMTYDAQELFHTEFYNTSYEHTVVIDDNRMCLLLPTLPKRTILFDLSLIVATILIGLLLGLIVWFVSVTLTVSERFRDPMNIVSMILGIAPQHEPRSLVEKILFVSMIITAAGYTAVFQAELLQFAIEYVGYLSVSNFQDLFKTDLEILVPPMVYDILPTVEQLHPALLRRFTPVTREDLGHGRLDASKAYFISEIDGKLAEIATVDAEGRRLLKLYDLCVTWLNRVHTLPVRSPYKNEIDHVLLFLAEYGFTKKHIDDFWDNNGARNAEDEPEIIINNLSLPYVAFIVILVGHLISLIVFAGELTAGQLLIHQRPA